MSEPTAIFGSLDPETLEVAISALESLRQNQETVGVISPVSLLRERIGTQAVVSGRDMLRGVCRANRAPAAHSSLAGRGFSAMLRLEPGSRRVKPVW